MQICREFGRFQGLLEVFKSHAVNYEAANKSASAQLGSEEALLEGILAGKVDAPWEVGAKEGVLTKWKDWSKELRFVAEINDVTVEAVSVHSRRNGNCNGNCITVGVAGCRGAHFAK